MNIDKQQLLARFSEPKKKRTESQALCDEVYEYFVGEIPYGQLLGFCKNMGTRAVREIFEEFKKHSKINTPAYFLGIIRNNKTIWNENT